MARKNPFASLIDEPADKPAKPVMDYTMRGATRSLASSIDEIAAKADRLVEGETIVEIDPSLVDGSFVKDRLSGDDEEFAQLLEGIRERGQDTPILVRPHPKEAGRYMVVFGHRRLRAAAVLDRKVRAIVKTVQDLDHVIAQGQENSQRANLAFIEKAFYAANLTKLSYDEATVLTALSIDKSTLSKMLSVAGLPEQILQAIGPAKAIGRDRWYELKQVLERPGQLEIAQKIVGEGAFNSLSSDARFNELLARVKSSRPAGRAHTASQRRSWAPRDGTLSAEILAEGKRFTLALKAKGPDASAFGEYLSDNLGKFYEAFREKSQSNKEN